VTKAEAAIKMANDAFAELKKKLAPKEAALAKISAEYTPLAKVSSDADKALDAAKSKREALIAGLPKMEQEATALAAAAAKAKEALESAKGQYAQAAGELAKVTAN
jgi:chromosome segregation ATPase